VVCRQDDGVGGGVGRHLLASVVRKGRAVDKHGAVGDANGSRTEAYVVEESGVQDGQVGTQLGPYRPYVQKRNTLSSQRTRRPLEFL